MPPSEVQADDTTNEGDDTDKLRLPIELLTRIAVVLKRDRKYASLAVLASTSSLVYDVCVPHLYETIIVSKRNETTFVKNVANGIKMTDQVEDDVDETAHPDFRPNQAFNPRVDRAITYCRRLVFGRNCSIVLAKGLILRIAFGRGKGHSPALDKIVFDIQPERMTQDRAKTLEHEDIQDMMAWEGSHGYGPGSGSRGSNSRGGPLKTLLFHLQDSSWIFAASISTGIALFYREHGLGKLPECAFHQVSFDLVHTYRKAFAPVHAIVHFDTDVASWDYPQRRAILARWLWCRYWQSPVPESNNKSIKLYDLPSLMFSQDELPDDPEEASRLARECLTGIMTRYQTNFMHFHHIPKQPTKSVMPLVFLVDSASGAEIQWAEPNIDPDYQYEYTSDMGDFDTISLTESEWDLRHYVTEGYADEDDYGIHHTVAANPDIFGEEWRTLKIDDNLNAFMASLGI